MRDKKLDQLVAQMENYLECWKQYSHFVSLARAKKFTAEDEQQFLDVKAVLIQELEIIYAAIDCSSPSKEDVHNLLSNSPSLRYMGEGSDPSFRSMETAWHKIFVGFQAILGQLKVKQREMEGKSMFSSLFGKKK